MDYLGRGVRRVCQEKARLGRLTARGNLEALSIFQATERAAKAATERGRLSSLLEDVRNEMDLSRGPTTAEKLEQ